MGWHLGAEEPRVTTAIAPPVDINQTVVSTVVRLGKSKRRVAAVPTSCSLASFSSPVSRLGGSLEVRRRGIRPDVTIGC